MIRRLRKFSIKEKRIFLMLFAVLLPTVILFVAQYRTLSELRGKSKAAFEHNLRQTFFKIRENLEKRLLEDGRATLEKFPADALKNADDERIRASLTAIIAANPNVETAFAFARRAGNQNYLAVADNANVRELQTGENPPEVFKKINEEDLILPFIATAQSPPLNFSDDFLLTPGRCERCADPHQTQYLYVYRPISARGAADDLSLVGVRLKQSRLIENFVAPAILESASAIAAEQGDEIVFSVFDEKRNTLYTNARVDETVRAYEIQTPLARILPFWTIAGDFRRNGIESLSDSYFRFGLLLMILFFGLLAGGVWLIFRVTDREISLAQAKSAFVSNVSHELKTPLALIRLFAETLESGRVKNPEKAQEYYRIISNETLRLTQLINNILDFSAIEAGRKDYHFARADLSEITRQVADNYAYALENAGFEVQTSFAKNLPFVTVDRDAISQAILNLLNNAVKYSGAEKFVEITVKRTSSNNSGSNNGGEYVAVTVTDHGIGIEAAEQTMIFDDFYRVGGASDVHNVKGSGLGLAIVKHIVEAHGGRVSVSSVPQRGSAFTITLPAEKNLSAEKL